MLKMELDMVRAWVAHRLLQLRAQDGDRGNMTSETYCRQAGSSGNHAWSSWNVRG